ncbi:oligoendopeptidase F [Mycoplasmatota bacterium]|nr:oligoendopeptidase F [Mycoplasmatota bacterium]
MLKKWDLTTIFNSWNEWSDSFNEVKKQIQQLKNYETKLGEFKSFDEYYTFNENLFKEIRKLAVYAHMQNDLNTKDVHNDKKYKEIMMVYSDYTQANAFSRPEKLSTGKDKINKFLEKSKKLQEYKFEIENLFRMQEHILDKDKESIIANFSQSSNIASNLYSGLANADNSSEMVTLSNGEEIEVTNSNYRKYLAELKNQEDRFNVFKSVFSHYANHKNTYAAIYDSRVQADWANAKSRNYSSSLESYLFNDNVPKEVYLTLINTTKQNNKPIKKYIELRKKVLNITDYRTYDRFLPLVKSKSNYSYEEALKLFEKAASKIPGEFNEYAKIALQDGQVDVYEKPGKRTGAYSTSIYGYNPFILLNYDNSLGDVLTVAHEAGHSMHTLFASKAQPFATAGYTIFVAEVASTFNEHLLLDYLFDNLTDNNEKIVLLQQAIDDILGTFYRQSLFADYEYQAHKLVEEGNPITYSALSTIMKNLYREYYDLDLENEEVKEFVWAYIPHLFYTPFYVYKYATSYAASLKIYEDVKNGKQGALDKYLGLLKSGGSEYPVDQVKKAGVDLTTKDPFVAVINRLDELINKLQEVL